MQALLVLLAVLAGAAGRPLRILAVMNIDTMSHHFWMSALTVELARRGHHVRSVDIAVPKEVPPTLNVTVLETAFDGFIANTVKGWDRNVVAKNHLVHVFSQNECETDLNTPTMARLIDESNPAAFDLIVLDYMADCFLGLAHRFGYPPVVVLSPFPGSFWLDNVIGIPAMPAVEPMVALACAAPMSLWQRAVNAALAVITRLEEDFYGRRQTEIIRRYFGEDAPTAAELRRRVVQLALVNEMPVIDGARPLPPSVIPVGGMHIRPANLSRIPADIRAWLDAAEDGFVFVSFGTMVRGANIQTVQKNALVEGFRALGRKVRVLWKIEDGVLEADGLPPNVRTSPWLPQNDLLAHPKMLLFVTHCGGLSTQEAAYHGVPMLGVPFSMDQFSNRLKVERAGLGRGLPYKDVTADGFLAELRELLGNPRYREAARRASEVLRDQKEPPLERAVWWVEHVARHGGAPHLRSTVLDVPWHQVMLLDVFALAVLAALAVVVAAVLLVRGSARCLGAAMHKTRVKQD